MTDADLIYNACLRAERLLEDYVESAKAEGGAAGFGAATALKSSLIAITTLRTEIGNGLTEEGR